MVTWDKSRRGKNPYQDISELELFRSNILCSIQHAICVFSALTKSDVPAISRWWNRDTKCVFEHFSLQLSIPSYCNPPYHAGVEHYSCISRYQRFNPKLSSYLFGVQFVFAFSSGAVFHLNYCSGQKATVDREIKIPMRQLAPYDGLWPNRCYSDIWCTVSCSLIFNNDCSTCKWHAEEITPFSEIGKLMSEGNYWVRDKNVSHLWNWIAYYIFRIEEWILHHCKENWILQCII